jgi:hypothetical protein
MKSGRLVRGLVVLALAAALGCEGVTPDRLIGEWASKCPVASVRLVLNKNGTYSQEASIKDRAEPIRNAGAWTLKSPQSGANVGWVQLRNCLSVCDGIGSVRKQWDETLAACSLPVGREHYMFGRLVLGDEDSFPYVKVQ